MFEKTGDVKVEGVLDNCSGCGLPVAKGATLCEGCQKKQVVATTDCVEKPA